MPVFFARGNRDFLLGERFEQATGARLLPEQHVVTLGGARTLLLHGDELCTADIEYQRYRARIDVRIDAVAKLHEDGRVSGLADPEGVHAVSACSSF